MKKVRKMQDPQSVHIKMVIIGEGGVGKTSIAKRYLREGYRKEYIRTIGADFYMQKRVYGLELGSFTIHWMIWDLSGQPTFNNVRKMFYKGAKAALLVYDISRPETYYNLPNWINEFWQKAGGSYPFVLIANKIDLRGTEYDNVPSSSGKKYAKILSEYAGFEVPYIETSALENWNIDESFRKLANLIFEWAKRASLV